MEWLLLLTILSSYQLPTLTVSKPVRRPASRTQAIRDLQWHSFAVVWT